MAKRLSRAEKIRRYITKHPFAKMKDVAAEFGTSYQIAYLIKRKMDSVKTPKASDFKPKTSVDTVPPKQAHEWKNVAKITSDTPVPVTMQPSKADAVTDVDEMLAERGKRYGTFIGHAHLTRTLKEALMDHAVSLNKKFYADEAEALDMICHKLGRIVNGDPHYADSWRDIAGYAKLVADRLESGKEV